MSSSLTLTWQTVTIGLSVQDRPLRMTLLKTVNYPQQAPLQALFVGAFHGDEAISERFLMRWLNNIEHHSLKTRPFYLAVLPCLNPDGVAAGSRVNANKVDINRNWPTRNWRENTEKPGSPYFGGSAPASEPETQALMRLIEQLQPRVIVSIHSPYRVVNYDGPLPDTLHLAEAMAAHNGYPVTASIGYPTPGSFGNWAGLERHIPTITLELPDLNEPTPGYPETSEALDERIWQENVNALWAVVAE